MQTDSYDLKNSDVQHLQAASELYYSKDLQI